MAEFYETIQNGNPTLAFGHSHMCPPCRQTEPVYNELGKKYGNKINFASMVASNRNIDKFFDEYNVEAYPTLIFLDNNGKEINRHVGALSKNELENMIKESFGATVKP